jgi:hypothetical protein
MVEIGLNIYVFTTSARWRPLVKDLHFTKYNGRKKEKNAHNKNKIEKEKMYH